MEPLIEGDVSALQASWDDGERVFYRTVRTRADGGRDNVLAVLLSADRATPGVLDRLAHEYDLRDDLDESWALRPLAFVRDRGKAVLTLTDSGGEPLERIIGAPLELGRFLQLAVALAGALGRLHQRGLIHKDIKPANVLVNSTTGEVRLTGFGITSRLPRERQPPGPPELLAGTLAYMAPEQTGRMNRSVDSRSDLYALGVTLYQLLTGTLPFTAADPMEWVHCHLARKPIPPSERFDRIPAAVSGIVMKLLAKTAEERYQTAAGVERDLRRCLTESPRGRIDDFPLGQQDTPDQLLIPEKLYGRAAEVETLLASFDRIVKAGPPELILVSGYSGIGKSSVVNELHRVLVPPRGLFAAGKFEQYKRDIPYATLAQAFQSLVRPLLGKSEREFGGWRSALLEALGANGQLMTDLVPELKLIIGEQPPVPELPPQDAQRRFQRLLRRFIGVFARAEHPLVLFLDDLQWLDAATLDLLEHLLTQPDLQHLMLIGAYRDNEVSAAHPLRRKLDDIKAANGKVAEITLAPLAEEHVAQLVAETLRCEPERAGPLARLVHEKTDGNPFFAIQFLASLAGENMLTFDHGMGRWTWHLDRIEAKRYTDNVVDLMVERLIRLPSTTQRAVQLLACLGNSADIATLAVVVGSSEDESHAILWPSVRQGLVERHGGSYKFIHDRVQEAAYSLVPEASRAEAHVRIGRLLLAHTPAGQRDDAIFEIVNQLNRGARLITAPEEREQLGELNLAAARRAKASTAYASALKYLTTGTAVLPQDVWQRRHDLVFALELLRAECEFLTGALGAAENGLAALSARARDTVERAAVACLRMDVYTTLDQSGRALEVGLDYLRHLGVDWSPHPTEQEARAEFARIFTQLGDRGIEELVDLPLMSDPASLATLDVLIKLWPAALFTDMNLFSLAMCRAVNLSLEQGNSDGSCAAYVRLGTIAGALFGDYRAAYRFGRLGYDLVEQRGLTRFQARTYMIFGSFVLPWAKHVKVGRDFIRRAFLNANEMGDHTYAAYCCAHLGTNMLTAGDPLPDAQQEIEHGLAFAQRMQFGLVGDVIRTQLALVRMLRGSTRKFGFLDDERFSEQQIERRFAGNPNLGYAACWYWIRKLQARLLAGDYAAAVDASLQPRSLLWMALSALEMADYHFYGALARAGAADTVSDEERTQHLIALAAHQKEIEVWAEHCPENFASCDALIRAEVARLERRDLDAMKLYQEAIRSARLNGLVQNEALAHEIAGRFYAMHGFEEIADLHLRSARNCYLRWRADGKVRQLDELYPRLRVDERVSGPMGTFGAPVEYLDLATVIKVSQAVSGEIVLDKLIATLLRTAIEQAGAERGFLVLLRGDALRIEAEATTAGDTVMVHRRDEAVAGTILPEQVLHYVLRTRESVILDNAAAEPPFAADPYIQQRRARSVLCLPLLTQAKLIGALYLENNLAPRAFAPARIAVLKLLASQAAIALENTHLYRDLAGREAKIRRLVDANIIGIFIGDLEGGIVEANDAFLRIVGYDREDLVSGRLRWTDLTPEEWRWRDAQTLEQLRTTGTAQPYEKEYVRKDGSRVPILLGAAIFEESGNQGLAFVLDLTERKRTEAEARESERRYREVQMELAHATRVATMGQLSASIAHEVNQPITGAIMSARAGLRLLGAEPMNVDAIRRALERIVRDGHRAAEVVDRVRALVKKAPPRKDVLDVNEAIVEIMRLTQGEIAKHGVSAQTQLASDLPRIEGDRVQLQQVMLNLIINGAEAMSAAPEGRRRLLISTSRTDADEVLVAVKDSGPGIEPANMEHIFGAFYTTKSGGLGMGLSICRAIIEAHSGRLWATSESEGALFQFTLPSCIRA